MRSPFSDPFFRYNRNCRKKIDYLEFDKLSEVVRTYHSVNSLSLKYELPERNLTSWIWLTDDNPTLRYGHFIGAYRHLGFGNATTPSIVLVRLYNHFFPDDAKPIESRKKRQSTKPNSADQINLSLQAAISDFHVATDQFLQQNICPQKTDAGNVPIATKNM